MKRIITLLRQRHSLTIGLLLLADAVFFSLTNPNHVASVVLIVGFVLIAATIYAILRVFMAIATVYQLVGKTRGRRIAGVLAIVCSIAIALQSLGELTLRDLVVLTLLSSIAYLYLSYGRKAD